MLARWHLLLGQFSVTFEYRPGAQHANADWMSRQCDQCRWPDCPVSTDLPDPTTSPYAIGLEMHWRLHTIRSVDIRVRRSGATSDCMTGELSDVCVPWEIGFCVNIPQQRNANLTLHGWVRI